MEMMNKGYTTTLAAVLAAHAVIAGMPGGHQAEAGQSKPNVLVIVTDDQRITGSTMVTGSTMKVLKSIRRRIQQKGQRYRNAFATTPLCCPSRASILTGRYVHNHGVRNNYEVLHLDPATAIPAHLKEHGYITGLFGKYLNGWNGPPPNFDRWAMHLGNLYYNSLWNINGQESEIPTYNADFIAQQTIDFLQETDGVDDETPWFAYLAPQGPHAPSTPADRHQESDVPQFDGNPAVFERNKSDKPGFVRKEHATFTDAQEVATKQLRTLLAIDEMFRQVDEALKTLHEKRNTLVIFMSDNGYAWAEHGLLGPEKSKNVPYLPAVKIPMSLRYPAVMSPGGVDTRLVANIDVAPTVYDAAGILKSIDHPLDGRSLLDSTWERKRLLLERFSQRGVDIPAWASVLTKRYEYTEYRRDGRIVFRELYWLGQDPWQISNVFGDRDNANDPEIRPLHARLKTLQRCSGHTGVERCP